MFFLHGVTKQPLSASGCRKQMSTSKQGSLHPPEVDVPGYEPSLVSPSGCPTGKNFLPQIPSASRYRGAEAIL